MRPFIQAEPMKSTPKTGAEVRNLTICLTSIRMLHSKHFDAKAIEWVRIQ